MASDLSKILKNSENWGAKKWQTIESGAGKKNEKKNSSYKINSRELN